MAMVADQDKYHIDKNILENLITEYSTTEMSFDKLCKSKNLDTYLTHVNINLNKDLKDKLLHARKDKARILAEQTIDVSDTENDSPKATNRIKSRQWLARCYDTETYGDKLTVDQNTSIKEYQVPMAVPCSDTPQQSPKTPNIESI